MNSSLHPCTLILLISLLLLSSVPSLVLSRVSKAIDVSQRSTYIVHVLPPEDEAFSNPLDLKTWHESFLQDAIAGSQLIYSYSDAFSGFAARLTKEELRAMEKKPGETGCSSADILAGLDSALKDGVDVISLSLGGPATEYPAEPVAIGGFRAVEKGIVVNAAGGNDGPAPNSVSNGAPWLLTVAASTTDRRFKATVRLGNGDEFDGETLYQPDNFTTKPLPLAALQCRLLRPGEASKKIVLCDSEFTSALQLGSNVLEAGGAGMIVFNPEQRGYTTMAYDHVLPASLVSHDAGLKILSYINSTENPTASLVFKGTILKEVAPEMSFFSSRGPNAVSTGILKPDITGPGVNILAAWPFPPRNAFRVTPRNRSFNVISGTSMSTPHLSGVAALVKSVHPDWSPAMIKSAIMTTAYDEASDGKLIKDEQHKEASIFAVGNGHVDPTKAADPGLVYDIEADDYIGYLCGLNYSDADLTTIAGRRVSCSDVKVVAEAELNYPTILVPLKSKSSEITRTVTNVGKASSTYKAQVEAPEGVDVVVEPVTLPFSKLNEKKSFTVTVSKGSRTLQGGWKAQLKWVSVDHVVKSVISEVVAVPPVA
ncbi:hypothetical protein J5N97_021674 [Dioscorea zingiberensis]|uniref:Uncharacterized protein n=1 Tax=Dioscorea zingiberensis TaxID=325984 RepID=A0A9D5C8R9_9LILI|nr:hypothetical protein J5N97_021674 [Dioscorea zingiberensis]